MLMFIMKNIGGYWSERNIDLHEFNYTKVLLGREIIWDFNTKKASRFFAFQRSLESLLKKFLHGIWCCQ